MSVLDFFTVNGACNGRAGVSDGHNDLDEHHPARWLLIAGLSAAALILAACSSGGGRSAGGGGSARTPLTPRQALLAAATQTRQVTSATELLTIQASGIQNDTITGTILVQLKPTLRLGANLHLATAGKSAQIKEILTGTAVYFHAASLNRQIGKPWVKIDLSALKRTAAASFAQLFHSLQNSNFANYAQMLTLAKNARVVGTQTVDGVSTTEYAASINAAEGRKALPAGFRKALAQELQALGSSTISFHVWIDGQHHMRKVTEVVTLHGETIHTAVNITALNQPVHITLPPASQTATRPGPLTRQLPQQRRDHRSVAIPCAVPCPMSDRVYEIGWPASRSRPDRDVRRCLHCQRRWVQRFGGCDASSG